MRIRVLDILHQTMADGPGFRTAIYCAGCKHACKGCHNPQSWDFNAGKWMEVEELLQIIKADDLSDVSFSGGDPFYQVEGFTEHQGRDQQDHLVLDGLHPGGDPGIGPAFSASSLSGRTGGRSIYPGAAGHRPPVPGKPQPEDHLSSRGSSQGRHPRDGCPGAFALVP